MTNVEFTPGVFIYCDFSDKMKARPLVPSVNDHRTRIIQMYHQLSHPGERETVRRVAERYYWPGMKSEIAKFVKKCRPCNLVKSKKVITPPLDPRPVLPPRFSDLQVDIVGLLVESEGYRYLLTVVCRTTRWLDVFPLTEATAPNICTAFLDGWVKNWGLPTTVTCDNGKTFTSRLWRDLNERLGNIISYTPVYAP